MPSRLTPQAALLAAAACVAALPSSAFAWGDDGHKIVGMIAGHFLDPAVKEQVNSILAGDTTQLVSPVDIPNEATWADKYRDSDRNSTMVRYNQTHNWHYVDIELNAPDIDVACNHHPSVPAGTPASAANPNDCVADKIEQFAAELANPLTTAQERRMALQFVLHFVGDLHQPLHSADDHDQGGNTKKVHGTGTSSNLHSSWDTPFVTALGPDDASIADTLIAAISDSQRAQWSQGASADWAQEAFLLAQSEAYGKLPAPNPDKSYNLSGDYVANAQGVVRGQLSKAGVRLAWVLNRALAGPGSPPPPPPPPKQLVGNSGFENGASNMSPWIATSNVISNDSDEPPHDGTWAAWLDGYGQTHTDQIRQRVTMPAGATSAKLNFWLHVDSSETTTTTAYDKLAVQLLDANGHVLQTLGNYSNLDSAPGYQHLSFDLTSFAGQTATLSFTGKEDKLKQTSFVIDDVTLDVN